MSNVQFQPRLRCNRTASLTLSTSWQTITFNGTSDLNVNTFGKDPVSGNQMVDLDATKQIINFTDIVDQNYICFMNLETNVTSVGTRATLQYRCGIPNGVSPGVDFYFPFPANQSTAFADIQEITVQIGGLRHNAQPFPLYLNSALRTNGMYIQLRISTALAVGSATLNSVDLIIQSTK